MGDAEFLLAMLQNLVATAQHAADVGANLHMKFPRRPGPQQRVITDHIADLKLGDADALGNFCDDRVREVAGFVLGVEKHGDQGGALDGVEGHELVEAGGQRGREEGSGL